MLQPWHHVALDGDGDRRHCVPHDYLYMKLVDTEIECLLKLYPESKSFVIPVPEIVRIFFDYVTMHHQIKGSGFGSGFGLSPNPN